MENVAQPSNIPAPQKSNGGLSLSGIVQVFYQPAAFFEKLKNNPKILIPWIIYFLLVLGTMFLIGDIVAKMQIDVRNEILSRQGITDTSKMPSLEQTKMQILIVGSLMMMLTPLIAAALGLFFGNIVMAGKAGFKQLLSVMLYGELLFTIGNLIVSVPLILKKQSMRASLSLAVLLKDSPIQSALYVAASKIGVFYIWEWIVIGIGLSIVYGFSRNKGYVLAVLSMGMISILHILMALITGAMF